MTEDNPQRERPENRIETLSDVSRRNLMRAAGVVATSGGALTGTAVANEHGDESETEDGEETGEVDEPEGFSAEVLAPHAPFADDVSAEFQVTYEDDGEEVVTLDDASTVIIAKVTWQPGGTSGWHTHPGPVIVNIIQGELEIVHEEECATHTYTAGEAFLDTGEHNEVARNPSETECTVVYATFLGVPDGEPATEWVEPQDC